LSLFRSYRAGRESFFRYGGPAFSDADVPFVRASGSQRVIDSASNWTQGENGSSIGLIRVKACSLVIKDIVTRACTVF
jgi:hypothetical protein